ncbi:MAG: AAA family ATPase [Saccharofermentans sp.]|nr:AAA family ATPase [Saccharofermentans sp.]
MIYLQSFKLSDSRLNCPNIYPYKVFRGNEGMVFFFDRITVLYGNNGSGKSSLLNQIASKLGIKGKEHVTASSLGTNDYGNRYVSECSAELGEDGLGRKLRRLPDDSRYIKSEDILYEVKKIQQKEVLGESLKYDRMSGGDSKEEAEDFLQSKKGMERMGNIIFAQEKYSNGETSLQYFDDFIRPDALYLLDEPEVSLSPANQVELSEKINEMARLMDCQFIIATHSPFLLGTLNAKIYDLDSKNYRIAEWTELENVRYFYEFFKKHDKEF